MKHNFFSKLASIFCVLGLTAGFMFSGNTVYAQQGATSLVIEPASRTMTANQTATYNVRLLNPTGLAVNGVQMFISYDPTKIEVSNLVRGTAVANTTDWNAQPFEIYNSTQIRAVLFSTNQTLTAQSSIVATFTVRALASTGTLGTQLQFATDIKNSLENKVKVFGDVRGNHLGTASPATVIVSGGTNPTATPTSGNQATPTPTRTPTPTPTTSIGNNVDLELRPSKTTLALNETMQIDIRLKNPSALNVNSAQIFLLTDAARLQIIQLTPSALFASGGWQQNISPEVFESRQARMGYINFSSGTTLADVNLATVVVKAVGAGTTTVDFGDDLRTNSTTLITARGIDGDILRNSPGITVTIGGGSTPTPTVTLNPTATLTPIPTSTRVPTPTLTVGPGTPTPTRINTPTATLIPTSTVAPGTPTPTNSQPTATPTSDGSQPTATPTEIPDENKDTVVITRTSIEKVFDLLGLKLWRLKVYARSDMSPEAQLRVDLKDWQVFPLGDSMRYNPTTDEYEFDKVIYQEVVRVTVLSSLGGVHSARVPFDGFGGNPTPTPTPTPQPGDPTLTPTPTVVGQPTATPTSGNTQPTATPTVNVQPSATPTDAPNTVSAFIDPANMNLTANGEGILQVKVRNSSGLPVNSVTLFVDIDPNILNLTEVRVGSDLASGGWTEGYRQIHNNRQIRFQFVNFSGSSTNAVIHVADMVVRARGNAGSSLVSFVNDAATNYPNVVTVRNVDESVLAATVNGRVTIGGGGVSTPTPTSVPQPTSTRVPTSTPTSILTPTATSTPRPTNTPLPSNTPVPTTPPGGPTATPTPAVLSCGAQCDGLGDARCPGDCTCLPVQGSRPRIFICGGSGEEVSPTPTFAVATVTPPISTLTPTPIPQPDTPTREEVQQMIRDALRDVFQRMIEYLNNLF